MVAQDDTGVLHDAESVEKLLAIPAEAERLPELPIGTQSENDSSARADLPSFDFNSAFVPLTSALDQEINRQKNVILSALEMRNLASFTQETDKLDSWADDLKIGLEREIKDLDRRIKETRTLSKGAATLAEKLAVQKDQRDIEAMRDRKRRELFDRQDEIQGRRDSLIDELEKQLKQNVTTTRLFAVEMGDSLMAALPTNFLNILKAKLEREFVPHLPELLNKNRPKDDQDKKQLSRAFSGFVLHKMLNIGIVEAAQSVVDDFDDNGLDAIYYVAPDKILYLVQTKFEATKQFDEPDAIRFRNGAELLLAQRYDRFNPNVQERTDELNDAFDEAESIRLVVAYIGSGFSEHANKALKVLTEDADHHESARLQAEIEKYGPDKIQADLLAEQSLGVVNDSLRLTKLQHLGGHRDTHIGVALVSDLVALHLKHEKALYERNIRYFLGSRQSDVNKSIQETLRKAPDDFFYLNNGVTALADLIEAPQGTKAIKRLRLRGLSVINGAQTISSAAEFVAQNPECDISAAKVLVTIIKADSEGKFGRSVTRARNHQNPVSTGNFHPLIHGRKTCVEN